MIRRWRRAFTGDARRGFTLIEILVALALVALILGAGLRLVSAGLNDSDAAERHTFAILIAESRLAEAGAAARLEPGATEGTAPGGYRWRRDVRPLAGIADDDPLPLYSITVEVTWDDRPGLRLSTVRP